MALNRCPSLVTRLVRLEARAPAPLDGDEPRDEGERLVAFEGLGRDGFFAAEEPDFPIALALFRDALAAGHADPAPPPEFESGYPSPYQRLSNWRPVGRFPDLDAAFTWLAELFHCEDEGTAPLGKAASRYSGHPNGLRLAAQKSYLEVLAPIPPGGSHWGRGGGVFLLFCEPLVNPFEPGVGLGWLPKSEVSHCQKSPRDRHGLVVAQHFGGTEQCLPRLLPLPRPVVSDAEANER